MYHDFESHTITRRSFLKGAGAVGAAGLLAACGGSSSSTAASASSASSGAAASGKGLSELFTYETSGREIESWNMLYSQQAIDFNVTTNIIDGLISFDNYGKPVPALAKSWEHNEDSTVWTFHLRDDVDWVDMNGEVQDHLTSKDFLVGFEYFRDKSTAFDERQPLTQYYEQMKHSLLENDNYVEALIDANDALFTVDLTHGQLEQIFYRTTALRQFDLQMTLPCSYDDYCAQRRHFVTPETLENYRIVDTASKLLERFHSGFKYVTVEYREQTSCGEPIWLQKTVLMAQDTVFDAASGREMPVIHGIILFRDTSIFHAQEQAENQRLQEAFEEADSASRAKTAFMNRMSHDIRTPINGILGMLDILRSNRDDARKVDSCLDKIDLSAHHLLALVNDVLDMSKLEAGQMVMEQEPFDIEVLMHGVSSLVEAQIEKDGLTHRRHRENIQHTALVGSSLKLRQIMVNLFSNAIKYNKPGGSIDTYAKELSCDGTTVWYEFRITDTGIGMSRDFVENQLFKPFTQESADARTQYRGTGLGMSIVKELVSQMGGSISAESQPGEGTAFTFQLPFLLDKNAAAKPQPKPTDNGRLDGMRILLVEDNDINMEVAEFQLTSQGAAVDKAWNGREAVERFAASAPGGYQAILMDVMMPVMDGFEASRAIRALDRPDAATVPILAMTAQASDECAQSCHRVGMNGRLVKPLDAKKLAKSIREAVQNKQ